jgi:hypothetical protein
VTVGIRANSYDRPKKLTLIPTVMLRKSLTGFG